MAYSIDTDEYIDPDRAYDLYWSGVITDKHNFLCPGANCDAQVTCANLTEDLQNMKVVPHYRVYGKHSGECEVFIQKPLSINYEAGSDKSEECLTLDQSIADTFLLQRPSSYYEERVPSTNEKAPPQNVLIAKMKADARLREIGSVGKIYSVRSVVSRYIRYKNDGSLSHRRVNILGKDVTYRGIFKCIWEQDLDMLPDYPVIYYGWAYINRLKSGYGYQIKFKKQFVKGGEGLTTTIMIADRLISGYKIKKLVSTRLEKIISTAGSTAFVFIYSKPVVNESNGKQYANFEITNLDMIDINYDCPLPKEYNDQ